MINIVKLDLDELHKQIYIYEKENGRHPKYVVMSQETLDTIKYYSGFHTVVSQMDFSSKLCGIKIAINDTLQLGKADIVG